MSSFVRVAAVIGLAVAAPALADFTNASFENTNFNTGTNFAGGISRNLANLTPDAWTYQAARTGNTDRWVKSSAAHTGNKYIYISALNAYPNDDCLLSTPCFEAGKTFQFSAFIASASTLAGTNRANFEFREYLSSGGTFDSIYSFDLPANPNWSDTALTTIPWVQYLQNHTYRADAVRADFWISAQRSASGGTSSVVFDDIDCNPFIIPAPSAAALIGAAGLLAARRRRN